jgi:peptidoglycan/xylan/chitin deacetylase (PgdA/CDA1 family)
MTNYLQHGEQRQAVPDGVRSLRYAQLGTLQQNTYLELLEVATARGLVRLFHEHGPHGYRWRILSNLCDGRTLAEQAALFEHVLATRSTELFTDWQPYPYWESPAYRDRQGQSPWVLQMFVRDAVRSQLELWDALRALENELEYEDDAERISAEIALFCSTCAAPADVTQVQWSKLAERIVAIAKTKPPEQA